MEYTEITVSTNTFGADIVSEALMRLGAAGTQIIDRQDVPPVDQPGKYWELIDRALLDAMPEDVQVKAWFERGKVPGHLRETITTLPALCGFDLGPLAITGSDVREEDWAETWKQYFKPFRAGERLVIKPSWESWNAQPQDLVIELDPGMAFGTGTHETTALCVRLIEQYCHGGSLLDIGTGSGILALAAARLGARNVLGVDIDPMAVQVARENVRKNGLENTVRVEEGNLTNGLEHPPFDIAVANILADVILLLLPDLPAHLKKDGVFICSGILRERAQEVREALEAKGFTVLQYVEQGDWAAFAASRSLPQKQQ